MKEKKKLSLAAKTFIGFGLGIVIGLIFKEKASVIKPIGTIFLNMIKMIVVPMVFCSITAGVASLSDIKKLRNIGVKVLVIYAVTSAISTLIGFLVANVVNPGKGFDMSALGEVAYEAKEMPSVLDTIIDMFPTNVFQSFVNGNMLQIIVFAIFLGIALIMLGEKGRKMTTAVQYVADAMYKITAIVMEFSPIGVCALLADSVGSYGLKVFGPLGKLILTVYAADVVLILVMYVPMLAFLARFPVGKFFKGILPLWAVTLSTTSSAGSLPLTASIAAYREADVVVLASPLYYWFISGFLKNAFDRLFAVAECDGYRNPEKESVLIMAAEGDGFEESEHWYDHLERHIGWKSLGKVLCGNVTQPGDTDGKPELQQAYELGRSIR